MSEENKYEIKKAPPEMMNKSRGKQRGEFPIEKLEVGEMFEAEEQCRSSIHNAIKHRRSYTREIEGRVFTIKSIGDKKIACIRLK